MSASGLLESIFCQHVGLQIKPVGSFCSTQCDYCYAEPFKHPRFTIIPMETLQKVLTNYTKIAEVPVISWHGGEPAMAGYELSAR